MSNENVSPGDKCYTLGWGLEDYFEGSESKNMSTYLKLLEIVIHDDEDCSREFYTDMYLQNHIFCGRTTLGCGKTMPVNNLLIYSTPKTYFFLNMMKFLICATF